MKIRPDLTLALVLAAAIAGCSDSTDATSGSEPAAGAEAPSPEPAAFYVGRWAADPVWCTDQSEGFPITITETRFEGRENICEMSGMEETPEGGVTAQLSCQSLGETVEEPIAFAPPASRSPSPTPTAAVSRSCSRVARANSRTALVLPAIVVSLPNGIGEEQHR